MFAADKCYLKLKNNLYFSLATNLDNDYRYMKSNLVLILIR